jgi:hypothetical protein
MRRAKKSPRALRAEITSRVFLLGGMARELARAASFPRAGGDPVRLWPLGRNARADNPRHSSPPPSETDFLKGSNDA